MTVTTQYGSWSRRANGSATLRGQIEDSLYEWPGIDIDAVESDYRAAINAALPDSVSLCGDEFYGNYYESDCADQDGYPHDSNGMLDIAAIIEGVDFWAIVDRHDVSPEDAQ